jgi:hypothetical protein
MICTLTARRLKSGSYDEFRSAWNPDDVEAVQRLGWRRVFHCRDVADPDVVISFGLFEGTLEELREAQQQAGRGSQVDRIAPHVEEVLLDGSYEVIETLEVS